MSKYYSLQIDTLRTVRSPDGQMVPAILRTEISKDAYERAVADQARKREAGIPTRINLEVAEGVILASQANS